MPRSRLGAVTSNGHNTIRWPGAYRHALERLCDRDAPRKACEYLRAPDPLSEDDVDVEAWERGVAECKAKLIAERGGEPVRVQSQMLPDGMPSPMFDQWPRGGISRGSFTITPDDVVTFTPRGSNGTVKHAAG